MAGRRLRLVRVNATELVGLEQTGRQFRACGSRAFLLCGVCTSRHPVSRFFSRWMSEFDPERTSGLCNKQLEVQPLLS